MITYKIEKHIGAIEENGDWKTEVNLISWNGRAAKIDIRPWNSDRSRIGKGITLTKEATDKLRELLKEV